mgnify:CR=1 FL=1
MKIERIRCVGFRSLKDVNIELANYNTLIGKNDSGKSSLLLALNKLFDPELRLTSDDKCKLPFYDGDCFVEAEISGIKSGLGSAGTLVVRKSLDQGLQYKSKVPANETIRKMMDGHLLKGDISKLPEKIRAIVNKEVAALPKGKIPSENATTIYEKLKADKLLEFTDGWARMDERELSALIRVVFLSANMRGEEETQYTGNSVLTSVCGQLLRDAVAKDPGIAKITDEYEAEIGRVFQKNASGQWELTELNEFQDVLNEEIKRFDSGINSESVLHPPKIPTINFGLSLEISDGCVTGIDYMGHGLRRSIVFAMLRTHRRLRQNKTSGGHRSGPFYLFLIEEPELYLHPQAERRRMNELKELANEANTQVVLCTHSAFFVDLSEYKGIHRFERRDRLETRVEVWDGPDLDPETAETVSLICRTNSQHSAMVFADLVILVEGESEQIAIPYVARKLELEDSGIDIEVVSCGGCSKIPPIQKILEGLRIRYVAWLDNANKNDKADIAKAKKARSREYGRIVITDRNWETMNKLSGNESKIYKSWKHFIKDGNMPNEEFEKRLRAAYSFQDYGI